ncbi:MAG: hypothetical protein ACTSRI_02810 [Promethearchaeota archaeon]
MEKSKKKKENQQQNILKALVNSAEIQIENLSEINKKIEKLQGD